MGLYAINCPRCGKAHQWFSGNNDQRCPSCFNAVPDQSNKPKGRIEYHGDVIHAPDAGKVGIDMKTRTTKVLDALKKLNAKLDTMTPDEISKMIDENGSGLFRPETFGPLENAIAKPAAPREWTLHIEENDGEGSAYPIGIIDTGRTGGFDKVHVIEYSAYGAVVKERDEFQQLALRAQTREVELREQVARLEDELASVHETLGLKAKEWAHSFEQIASLEAEIRLHNTIVTQLQRAQKARIEILEAELAEAKKLTCGNAPLLTAMQNMQTAEHQRRAAEKERDQALAEVGRDKAENAELWTKLYAQEAFKK